MFLWRGNTVRHFERHHDGKGHMLKEGRKPTAPIYQNMESFQEDPFNVKPKPWPKKLAELDPTDVDDLQDSIAEHTARFADGFEVGDHVVNEKSSTLSDAPSLMAPRKKLLSCLGSAALRRRRLKNERPVSIDKRAYNSLAKNFYTAKVLYRRQWQRERKKAFWHANKSKNS